MFKDEVKNQIISMINFRIIEDKNLTKDKILELIDKELQDNPNLDGFEYVIDKIEEGLKQII